MTHEIPMETLKLLTAAKEALRVNYLDTEEQIKVAFMLEEAILEFYKKAGWKKPYQGERVSDARGMSKTRDSTTSLLKETERKRQFSELLALEMVPASASSPPTSQWQSDRDRQWQTAHPENGSAAAMSEKPLRAPPYSRRRRPTG